MPKNITLRKTLLLEFDSKTLSTALKGFDIKDYQIKQIADWLYVKKASSFDQFTNISKDLRTALSEKFILRSMSVAKKEVSRLDGTIRYTFKTVDKKTVYAVYLPSGEKNSVCISSQIGCPIACEFCSSGRVNFERNLTRGEILEQILQIENDTQKRVGGVLFMGMGEPMLNYNNVSSAIKTIIDKRELGIGKRHITLSTAGITPAIKKLADDNFGIRLAVSLHAADNFTRKQIIPALSQTDISEVLTAAAYYLKKTSSRLTIEYILIQGVNDAPKDAHKLSRLIRATGLTNPNVQINLIPYNPVKGSGFNPPSPENINKFKSLLKVSGIITNVREAKGADIGAACGQLGI
ncbi:MAG: 23S rRNA (adenine(2503)-C(2))-methyltransferase RlmN [Elusimicrobia bacterium]|nr:23S rRNA (adenine(2503)-C(2))-methyltransferase RlmN [Elusimicrobiota bacterium]